MEIGHNSCNSSSVETLASTADDTFLPALLHAVGDLARFRILFLLLDGPRTQKELSVALKLNSGTLSKHMAKLAAARIVARKHRHGAWELRLKDDVWQLLQSYLKLNRATSEEFLQAAVTMEAELNRAGMSSPSDLESETA